jgi:hypothetical protein
MRGTPRVVEGQTSSTAGDGWVTLTLVPNQLFPAASERLQRAVLHQGVSTGRSWTRRDRGLSPRAGPIWQADRQTSCAGRRGSLRSPAPSERPSISLKTSSASIRRLPTRRMARLPPGCSRAWLNKSSHHPWARHRRSGRGGGLQGDAFEVGDEVFGSVLHANPAVHEGGWADLRRDRKDSVARGGEAVRGGGSVSHLFYCAYACARKKYAVGASDERAPERSRGAAMADSRHSGVRPNTSGEHRSQRSRERALRRGRRRREQPLACRRA